eukprot:gene2555-2595_t
MRDQKKPIHRSLKSGASREPIRWRDEARFIKNWFDRPLMTGAVSPSGRMLAAKMASSINIDGTDPIIELGPGTGPVTEALLERGIAPERLILIEFNPDFCAALRRRFPEVNVIEGDAYGLAQTLAEAGIHRAAAIVSSLPLLTHSEAKRLKLLEEAFCLLKSGGPLIQFTYSFQSPIPLEVSGQPIPGIIAEVSPVIWMNLPPARVWTYRSAGFAFNADLDYSRLSLSDFVREKTEKLREDRHVKPAIAFLKRIGHHFDKQKPPY